MLLPSKKTFSPVTVQKLVMSLPGAPCTRPVARSATATVALSLIGVESPVMPPGAISLTVMPLWKAAWAGSVASASAMPRKAPSRRRTGTKRVS